MDLSWDEGKRARVLADRAIDFLDLAARLSDGRPLMTVSVMRHDEERSSPSVPLTGSSSRFYGRIVTVAYG